VTDASLQQVRPGYRGARPRVSVVILTLNEEDNLPDALDSCAWCDDVHILDSGSTDNTERIAREREAHFRTNPFESFGQQRNWALDNIPFRHDWLFHLDADERFTPELVAEMAAVLQTDPKRDGFFVPSKLIFMGRWLKRSGGYPNYQMRLLHRGRMRFIDHGHGQREAPGTSVGALREGYLHHGFSKGLDDWFERHNRYSRLEAEQALADEGTPIRLSGLFSDDRVTRRRTLKRLACKLPIRPQLRLVHALIANGGIFEGRAGWTHAQLMAIYERMIVVKAKQLRHARENEQKPML